MPAHMKDILLGLLAAYVAVDLLLAYASKSRHPGLLAVLQQSMNDENVAVVLVIGVCVGLLVYVLARRSRQLFTTKKDESQ